MLSAKTIGIIAAVIIVGGGAVAIAHHSSQSASTPSVENASMTASTTMPAADSSGKKVPFADMVKQGGSYQCVVHSDIANFKSTSTIFINNGMMSANFNTTVQGRNISSNFIQRDGFDYTWTSYVPTMGYKVPVTVVADANANAMAAGGGAPSGSMTWNANQVGDYNCQPWTPDSAKFALPASVKFTEVSRPQ